MPEEPTLRSSTDAPLPSPTPAAAPAPTTPRSRSALGSSVSVISIAPAAPSTEPSPAAEPPRNRIGSRRPGCSSGLSMCCTDLCARPGCATRAPRPESAGHSSPQHSSALKSRWIGRRRHPLPPLSRSGGRDSTIQGPALFDAAAPSWLAPHPDTALRRPARKPPAEPVPVADGQPSRKATARKRAANRHPRARHPARPWTGTARLLAAVQCRVLIAPSPPPPISHNPEF